MIKVGLGQSEKIDTRTAVESAIKQCQQRLAGYQPQAGIVFAGVNFDHRLMLDKILDKFPGLNLIGCTTAGEFSTSYGFSDDSISLIVFYSNDIEIGIGIGRSLSDNPDAAVQNAVDQASHKLSEQASICLAFPDGFNRSFDAIMKKLNLALGNDCPVFGGAAGTLWNEELMPLQFFNNEILVDSIPIMIFAGPLEYSFSIANSWKPIGKQAKITRAEGRLVRRIDEFKAVDFYQYYLGDHSEPAREFLLAVYDKDSEHSYLRAPKEYNSDGSITFSESIPQGATVQLTEAIREIIIEDTKSTSKKMVQQVPDLMPAFAMAFSCAFRKDMLGTRVEQEFQILRGNLPEQLPIVGFYSFGEIAPLVMGQESFFHGATLVTLLVGQSNGSAVKIDETEEAQSLDERPAPISLRDLDATQYM